MARNQSAAAPRACDRDATTAGSDDWTDPGGRRVTMTEEPPRLPWRGTVSRSDQERHDEVVAFAASRSTTSFRTACPMVGDRGLAQDLLREALTTTDVAWPRLRDVSRAEPSTRRVVVTTAISWRRRRVAVSVARSTDRSGPCAPLSSPSRHRGEARPPVTRRIARRDVEDRMPRGATRPGTGARVPELCP